MRPLNDLLQPMNKFSFIKMLPGIRMKVMFLLMILMIAVVHAKAQAPNTALRSSVLRGKVVYQQNCLSCHQEDGSGVSRLNPPLIKTSYVLGDQTKLMKIVLNGLDEEIEINGEYYSNPMPAFADVLKDQEVADVLTYIRNNFGNKASVVPVSLVKTVRSTLKK
jgi:mono/diheme cytochrome c family protein